MVAIDHYRRFIAYIALEGFVERLENPVESCPGMNIQGVSDLVLATPKNPP